MIQIGKQRECFWDNYLIDEEKTTAPMRLHKPVRRKVLLELDQPWEGNLSTFFNPVYAEGKWHLYYVCNHGPERYVVYAESDDGEHWVRPDLGIVEHNGSRHNNIILNVEMLKEFGFTSFDNMCVFYDENPVARKRKNIKWWLGGLDMLP